MMVFLLLLALGGIYALRYYRFFANRVQGTLMRRRPLPLLARMRLHAVPALFGVLLALAFIVLAHASRWVIGVPIFGYLVLLTLPLSYQLTTEGIRLGRGTFRRWTEFAGARRFRGGAILQGANGRRGMRVWLSRTRGDDEFLLQIRRAIRDAYQGGREDTVPVTPTSVDHPDRAMPQPVGTH